MTINFVWVVHDDLELAKMIAQEKEQRQEYSNEVSDHPNPNVVKETFSG